MNRVADQDGRIPLDATHLERFHRLAPAALTARSGGFLLEQAGASVDYLILGLVPTIGMLGYGWKASELLAFLIAGAWIAIAGEFVRYLLLRRLMRSSAKKADEELFVWLVVQTLRRGQKSMPKELVEMKHVPELGVVADLVAGGFGTLLLALMLSDKRPEMFREVWESAGAIWSLWVVAGWQFVSVLYETIDCYWLSGGTRLVKSRAGVRGPGLFILLFLFLTIVVSFEQDATTLLLVVNWFMVLIGAIGLVGVLFLRNDIRWLREYLANRNVRKSVHLDAESLKPD